jgi:hypothetical protein
VLAFGMAGHYAELAGFSHEVFHLRKGKWLLWAAQSWPRAVLKIAYRYWILQAAIPLLFLLFVVRRLRCGKQRHFADELVGAPWNAATLPTVLCLNILYGAAAISVVILSATKEDSRGIVPAGVFLPSLIGLLIPQELRLLVAEQRLRARI